ncbi:MAG: RNase P subunit p30 family protein [Promethearchaeota archaeon]
MYYFESRLPVDFENYKVLNHKLEICKKLRIKNLILEPKNKFYKIPNEIKYKIEGQNPEFNLFYRINLKVNNPEDFKKLIKKFNKFHDILSIESLSKEVQLQAARDSRVDIISFSNQDIIKTLTPGVVSLSKQNNSFIEFSLAPIMVNNKAIQSKNFRNLYKFVQLAFKFNSNCIISGNFDEIYDLRHPRALISICHSLLGISLVDAKKIFTINPLSLLERVKKRSNTNFDPDVKLIKGDELL